MLLLLGIASGLFACEPSARTTSSASSAPGWSPVPAGREPDAYADQRRVATEARDAMFARLMGELSGALANAGPADAIRVCAERAPAIAAEVGAERNVRIGRTSFALRNSSNRAPEWASSSVRARAEDPAIFVHEDGRLAVLTPIRLAPNCVMCHGAPEQLAPGVSEALASLYPDDRATGFAEGQLRGWFWVEVPPDAPAGG